LQNFPNPFNGETKISYEIPQTINQAVKVQLNIFNLNGQMIRTLVDKVQNPGAYQVKWNGEDNSGGSVASGCYFYIIKAGEFISKKKMTHLK